MGMAVMPAIAAVAKTHWLQFDISYPGRDIQPGLALHADGLQRVGIRRAADQKVAAETDSDRCVGADATVIAREIAASNPPRWRVHRPGESGLVGETEIDAVAADGCNVGFGTAAFALEHTFEAGHRADHEAAILPPRAFHDPATNPPH